VNGIIDPNYRVHEQRGYASFNLETTKEIITDDHVITN
jgi:hypothetical protein